MEKKGLEALETLLSQTLQAMAGKRKLAVSFSQNPASVKGGKVNLPRLRQRPDASQAARFRGMADGLALRIRHHDSKAHRQYRPKGALAASLFDAMEQTRCEAIGTARLPGAAGNLAALLNHRCQEHGYETAHKRDQMPLRDALCLILREKLTGGEPPEAARGILALWRPWLEKRGGGNLADISEFLHDQSAFAQIARKLIADLALEDSSEAPEEDEEDTGHEQAEPKSGQQGEQQSEAQDDLQPRAMEEVSDEQTGEAMPVTATQQEQDRLESESNRHLANHPNSGPLAPGAAYRIFTDQYDEIIKAEKLAGIQELTQLRAELDRKLTPYQNLAARLANRLQRRLQAQQKRHWEFDLDSGLLDCARLARIVTDPLHSLSFKVEKTTVFRDTVIGLLIDNSGSMRGAPITIAAMCADILARSLERCGVRIEILGFTTKAWKGGRSREAWSAKTRPSNPGRLNDLRHIIYKTADEPLRRARKNLGLMLREGLLKENIDGEALLWAHARLAVRPEERRILFVISDGAPVDDSTLSVNPGNYLNHHLRHVIGQIENHSSVELYAIGIGHDVTRYYRQAVTISDAEKLAPVLTGQLAQLFFPDQATSKRKANLRAQR